MGGSVPPAHNQESSPNCVFVIFIHSTIYTPGYSEGYYTVYDEVSMRPHVLAGRHGTNGFNIPLWKFLSSHYTKEIHDILKKVR
jgi:hypothetical protein